MKQSPYGKATFPELNKMHLKYANAIHVHFASKSLNVLPLMNYYPNEDISH